MLPYTHPIEHPTMKPLSHHISGLKMDVCDFSQHRRHFSAAVCEGRIYAVGGWYLDSLVTPDSSTSVYTAVEVYDPWTDAWSFVSSLPLTDFQFSLSLSHDSPLTTSLGHCLYVLGNIARTGEKLVLRYDTRQGAVHDGTFIYFHTCSVYYGRYFIH